MLLVALALPGMDTVQKISIIPRGIAALGSRWQLPTEDRFPDDKSELETRSLCCLGGRVAEEAHLRENLHWRARRSLKRPTSPRAGQGLWQ